MGFLMFGQNTQSQITLNMPTHAIDSKIALWTTVSTKILNFRQEKYQSKILTPFLCVFLQVVNPLTKYPSHRNFCYTLEFILHYDGPPNSSVNSLMFVYICITAEPTGQKY